MLIRKIKLNFYHNIKILSIILIVIILTGCSNKYYFKKRLDNFTPSANEKFSIVKSDIPYSLEVFSKIKEKFQTIPLKYSVSRYVPYMVYINYKNRFLGLPVLQLIIVKKDNRNNAKDIIVYNSLVYSYNRDPIKSIAVSLKIITDDIVNRTYPKSKFIKIKSSNCKVNNTQVTNYNYNRDYSDEIKKNPIIRKDYKLYSKEESYSR